MGQLRKLTDEPSDIQPQARDLLAIIEQRPQAAHLAGSTGNLPAQIIPVPATKHLSPW